MLTEHSTAITIGNSLEVKVRRSLKAKRVAIKIISSKLVELVLPRVVDFAKAYNFLISKEAWIISKVSNITNNSSAILESISILGEEYQLIFNNREIDEPIKIIGDKIFISYVIPINKLNLILVPKLKKILKHEIESYAALRAKEINVVYNKISIREVRSRWGSCSKNKNLSFSWRLVLAPRHVMEYLVVHELCHLIEMNHSFKFWRLVYKLCPQYSLAEQWLKKYGRSLHDLF
jgi:predicted metal-dependent hydrolase